METNDRVIWKSPKKHPKNANFMVSAAYETLAKFNFYKQIEKSRFLRMAVMVKMKIIH